MACNSSLDMSTLSVENLNPVFQETVVSP
ncbi:protein of unknown function [Tenacibaculum aestuariivivum]